MVNPPTKCPVLSSFLSLILNYYKWILLRSCQASSDLILSPCGVQAIRAFHDRNFQMMGNRYVESVKPRGDKSESHTLRVGITVLYAVSTEAHGCH